MPEGGALNAFSQVIEFVGRGVDAAGVLVIVVGIVVATVRFLAQTRRADDTSTTFKSYRQGLGRALLLGLEVLVAADIIRTVAVSPTFQSVGVLAGIVVIRTFLSWSLEVELEGRWPWQGGKREQPGMCSAARSGRVNRRGEVFWDTHLLFWRA